MAQIKEFDADFNSLHNNIKKCWEENSVMGYFEILHHLNNLGLRKFDSIIHGKGEIISKKLDITIEPDIFRKLNDASDKWQKVIDLQNQAIQNEQKFKEVSHGNDKQSNGVVS